MAVVARASLRHAKLRYADVIRELPTRRAISTACSSSVLNGAEKGPTRGMRNSAAAPAAAAAVGPAAVGARMLQDDVCVEVRPK